MLSLIVIEIITKYFPFIGIENGDKITPKLLTNNELLRKKIVGIALKTYVFS